MKYSTKNPNLTAKALTFIYHKGRNTFDSMIMQLIKEKKNPIKEGWLKK